MLSRIFKISLTVSFAALFFTAFVFTGSYLFGTFVRDGEKNIKYHVKPGSEDYRNLIIELEQLVAESRQDPVDAIYNELYGLVVPELYGYELEVEATAHRLARTEKGQPVHPAWKEIRPAVKASQYPEAYIDRGIAIRKQVTLMINVAWGNQYLEELLEVLDEYGVKTTFFPVGRWAESYPELLNMIAVRGHELGNHGYADWEVFSDLDLQSARSSLQKTNEALNRLTGQQPRWFTPHKGDFNEVTRKAVADEGMRLLLWTLDTVDWRKQGAEAMAARILDNLVPGAIILMHPTEQSAGFLRLVLPELKERGYVVVTMSELLSPAIEPPGITLTR